MAGAATPISKLPLGLLGALGIKNFGEYPSYLGGQISAVMDLTGLLAANHAVSTRVDVTVSAPITSLPASLVVPQNEIWYVTQFSVFALTIAAEQITLGTLLSVASTAAAPAVLSLGEASGAGAIQISHARMTEKTWVGPGDSLGFSVRSITTAGLITVQVGCRRQIYGL